MPHNGPYVPLPSRLVRGDDYIIAVIILAALIVIALVAGYLLAAHGL